IEPTRFIASPIDAAGAARLYRESKAQPRVPSLLSSTFGLHFLEDQAVKQMRQLRATVAMEPVSMRFHGHGSLFRGSTKSWTSIRLCRETFVSHWLCTG